LKLNTRTDTNLKIADFHHLLQNTAHMDNYLNSTKNFNRGGTSLFDSAGILRFMNAMAQIAPSPTSE